MNPRCSHHYDGCHAWDSEDVLLEHIFGIRILCMGSGEMALLFLRTQVQFPDSSLFWYPQALHTGSTQTNTQAKNSTPPLFFLMWLI